VVREGKGSFNLWNSKRARSVNFHSLPSALEIFVKFTTALIIHIRGPNSLIHCQDRTIPHRIVCIGERADAKVAGALQKASAACSQETVEVLLNHGAQINGIDDSGQTALHIASSRGRMEIVQTLLENGADASIRDNNSKIAADLAVIKGHEWLVRFLIYSMIKQKRS
jgi:ankyrin repeat protein